MHDPHTHSGDEAFYVLEGTGEVTLGEEVITVAAGEAAVFDGDVLHGIRNAGTGTLRYMVIISAD